MVAPPSPAVATQANVAHLPAAVGALAKSLLPAPRRPVQEPAGMASKAVLGTMQIWVWTIMMLPVVCATLLILVVGTVWLRSATRELSFRARKRTSSMSSRGSFFERFSGVSERVGSVFDSPSPQMMPNPDATSDGFVLDKGDETGVGDYLSPECVASTVALTCRVQALGLHLGDNVISGMSIGLPNAQTGRPVFHGGNLQSLMQGENLISKLPEAQLQAQLDRNVVQVVKGANGVRQRVPLCATREVINLAGRIGAFDLEKEFGIEARVCETLDSTYALAVAAGLEALRDAGLVLPPSPTDAPGAAAPTAASACATAAATATATATNGHVGLANGFKPSDADTTTAGGAPARGDTSPGRSEGGCSVTAPPSVSSIGTNDATGAIYNSPPAAPVQPRGSGANAHPSSVAGARKAWTLAREHRDDTGVIFVASFPALDSLVEELARYMARGLAKASDATRTALLAELRGLSERLQEEQAARQEDEASRQASAAASGEVPGGYEFNRKLLFKLLVMANCQLAELIGARGPNLHINAACAGTTAAITLAHDWLRVGRCKRVVVIAADTPSNDRLMPWIGTGFLALGAATIKPDVREACLPFDRRRNGMLLGSGALGLVVEADYSCMQRAKMPLASIIACTHANSAFHASAICVKHASEVLKALVANVGRLYGLSPLELASSLIYVAHETCTFARSGGCAGAEVAALKAAFGEEGLSRILITNSKGMTGHPMGVCYEDVVAVASLAMRTVPPVVNHCEADPALGALRLSTGGQHDCTYALHFAAGFGSQVSYVLYKRT